MTAQRHADTEFESIPAESSDPQVPEQILTWVIEQAGHLDVLVNSAGMMQEALSEDMAPEQRPRNLTAPSLLIRAVLPFLRETQGNIVDIGSLDRPAANPDLRRTAPPRPGVTG